MVWRETRNMPAIWVTVYWRELYMRRASAACSSVSPGPPPAVVPFGAGGVEAVAGALADEVAFELGDRGEHVEQQLSAGRGGVDRLIGDGQVDAAVAESQHEVDQVFDGAAEPVQFGAYQRVAGPQVVQAGGEFRALGKLAARGVAKDPLASGGPEGGVLGFGVLVAGGDPGVADECHGQERATKGDWPRAVTPVSYMGSVTAGPGVSRCPRTPVIL